MKACQLLTMLNGAYNSILLFNDDDPSALTDRQIDRMVKVVD